MKPTITPIMTKNRTMPVRVVGSSETGVWSAMEGSDAVVGRNVGRAGWQESAGERRGFYSWGKTHLTVEKSVKLPAVAHPANETLSKLLR
jgi:hypothetical protein